jgi:hypothetical protein
MTQYYTKDQEIMFNDHYRHSNFFNDFFKEREVELHQNGVFVKKLKNVKSHQFTVNTGIGNDEIDAGENYTLVVKYANQTFVERVTEDFTVYRGVPDIPVYVPPSGTFHEGHGLFISAYRGMRHVKAGEVFDLNNSGTLGGNKFPEVMSRAIDKEYLGARNIGNQGGFGGGALYPDYFGQHKVFTDRVSYGEETTAGFSGTGSNPNQSKYHLMFGMSLAGVTIPTDTFPLLGRLTTFNNGFSDGLAIYLGWDGTDLLLTFGNPTDTNSMPLDNRVVIPNIPNDRFILEIIIDASLSPQATVKYHPINVVDVDTVNIGTSIDVTETFTQTGFVNNGGGSASTAALGLYWSSITYFNSILVGQEYTDVLDWHRMSFIVPD